MEELGTVRVFTPEQLLIFRGSCEPLGLVERDVRDKRTVGALLHDASGALRAALQDGASGLPGS